MRYLLRVTVVVAGLLAALLGSSAWAQSIMITGASGTTFQNACSSGTNPQAIVTANEPAGFSDNFTIAAPGFSGYTWTGENGPEIYTGTYGLGLTSTWGINVPADTPITGTILVYNQPNLGGSVVYKSAITWNCTTGVVASIVNTNLLGAGPVIPTLNQWMLAVLASLLLMAGILAARGKAKKKNPTNSI